MTKTLIPVVLMALSLLLLSQCQTQQQSSKLTSISPSFSQFDVEHEEMTFNADIGNTYRHPTGSVVEIPAKVFVDKSGNEVTGEVTVQYREFHTIADIITAGVPMTYENGSEKGYLKTAGMFEIRGYQDNSEVFVKEGGQIKVQLATFYKGNEQVNFYQFNKSTGSWKVTAENINATINTKAQAITAKIDSFATTTNPEKPKPADPNEPMIDFNIRGITGSNLDFALWKNAGPANEPNPLENSAFKTNRYRMANAYIVDRDLSLVNATFYVYESRNDSQKVTATLAPVLVGAELKKAEETYQKKLAARKKLELQMAQMATSRQKMAGQLRTLNLSASGLFNCDVFYRNEPKNFVLTLMDNKGQPIDTAMNIFVVRKNSQENGVLPVPYSGPKSEVQLFEDGTMHIVAVIDGKMVGTAPNAFTRKNRSEQVTKVKLGPLVSIDNKGDLETAIAQL